MFDYVQPDVQPIGELRVSHSPYGGGVLGGGPAYSPAASGAMEFHQHYSGVSVEDLRQRIQQFQSRPQWTLTDEELRDEVYNIMGGGKRRPITVVRSGIPVKAGESFFRARFISDQDSQLVTTADVWEPKPHHVAAAGRLNTSGEAILYTCLGTPATALMECRFEANDVFAMNRFEAKNDFQATVIGLDPLLPGLNEEDRLKLQEIQSFLDRSFSYKAGPDNLEPYRLSRFLALEFWAMPPQWTKGWAFRSIMDPSGRGWNFGFPPDVGRRALRYKETHLYRLHYLDDLGTRPQVELLAAFRAARHDKLARVSTARLQTTQSWL